MINSTVIANENKINQDLISAVLNGDLNETQNLLSRGADPNLKIVKNGTEVIFLAVFRNHSDIVQLLIKNGANIEAKLNGDTPLAKAICTAGAYEIAIVLIQLGANVNANAGTCRDIFAVAVGMAAKNSNKTPLVTELIAHGVDVNRVQDNENSITALDYAIRGKSLSLVKILVGVNVDLNKVSGVSNRTPLQTALYIDDDLQIFRFLLKSGANPNDSVGVKAGKILETAFYINRAALPALLQAGADPNQGDTYYKIIRNNETRLVELFLGHGANKNYFVNSRDTTPLILAARYGYTEIVSILIEKNADISGRNNDGDTAFDVSIKNGHISTGCTIKPNDEACLMSNNGK